MVTFSRVPGSPQLEAGMTGCYWWGGRSFQLLRFLLIPLGISSLMSCCFLQGTPLKFSSRFGSFKRKYQCYRRSAIFFCSD